MGEEGTATAEAKAPTIPQELESLENDHSDTRDRLVALEGAVAELVGSVGELAKAIEKIAKAKAAKSADGLDSIIGDTDEELTLELLNRRLLWIATALERAVGIIVTDKMPQLVGGDVVSTSSVEVGGTERAS